MNAVTADVLPEGHTTIKVCGATKLTIKAGRTDRKTHARLIVASGDNTTATITATAANTTGVTFSPSNPAGRGVYVGGDMTGGVNVTGDSNTVYGNSSFGAPRQEMRLTLPCGCGPLTICVTADGPTNFSGLIGVKNFTLYVNGERVLENGNRVKSPPLSS